VSTSLSLTHSPAFDSEEALISAAHFLALRSFMALFMMFRTTRPGNYHFPFIAFERDKLEIKIKFAALVAFGMNL
jgi:hypothetical protein